MAVWVSSLEQEEEENGAKKWYQAVRLPSITMIGCYASPSHPATLNTQDYWVTWSYLLTGKGPVAQLLSTASSLMAGSRGGLSGLPGEGLWKDRPGLGLPGPTVLPRGRPLAHHVGSRHKLS